MPISLSGLDLSWLQDPAKRLPPREKKQRTSFRHLRSDVPSPMFMSDIAPFVNVATREGGEITSRSHLREFEKRSGLVQVGSDFGEGRIAAENEARKAEWERLAATVDHGWTDPDF
jgi:hypothetical protein